MNHFSDFWEFSTNAVRINTTKYTMKKNLPHQHLAFILSFVPHLSAHFYLKSVKKIQNYLDFALPIGKELTIRRIESQGSPFLVCLL